MNSQDMKKMRQEAVKHVREMHSKAKPPKKEPEPAPKAPPKVPKKKVSLFGDLSDILDLVFKDGEKTLIVILISLLIGDEDNLGILLVLVFLLM